MVEIKVDAKGMMCPRPIMETFRAAKGANVGDIIVVEATDESFFNDIKAWCEKTGNVLLKLENRITFYRAEIKKTDE